MAIGFLSTAGGNPKTKVCDYLKNLLLLGDGKSNLRSKKVGNFSKCKRNKIAVMILDLDRLITFNSKRLFQNFRLKKRFLHVPYFLDETFDLDCGQPCINARAKLIILKKRRCMGRGKAIYCRRRPSNSLLGLDYGKIRWFDQLPLCVLEWVLK